MNRIVYIILLCLGIGFPLYGQGGSPSGNQFELISLPYATDALEPIISKQTMELHHGKHLRGYVAKLNALIAGTKYYGRDLRDIVRSSGGSIFDNAGQILNHNLYFSQFSPGGKPLSQGPLQEQIRKQYGDFSQFQRTFEEAGLGLFGSGWLYLCRRELGDLVIVTEVNGSNPIVRGLEPLLGVDLWEHAYYLDYQNRRADHLKALWSIIDWSVVEDRYVTYSR